MTSHNLRTLIFSCLALLFVTQAAHAKDSVYTSFFSDTAASGYDVVAYFTENKPVEGKDKFSYEWNGAEWLFSSRENLALFKANPKKYAPQYGGYCAYAISQGYTAKSVPEAWDIVDGKLYLNLSLSVRKTWQANQTQYIRKADTNWPAVLK